MFPSLLISFTSISDPALCWISEGCKKLETLKLDGCGNLTDSGMHYLAQGSNRFRSLSLKGCTKLTDYGMRALMESPVVEKIEALDLSGCLFLEDPTISALGEYCHLLKDLNLMGLSRCTDVGFKVLGEGCPNLECLDLSIDLSFLDTTHRSRIPRYGDVMSRYAMKLWLVRFTESTNHCCCHVSSKTLFYFYFLTFAKIHVLYRFTNKSLFLLSKSCPKLRNLKLAGAVRITEKGFHELRAFTGN